jgi:hypothetical protein
MLDHLVTVLGGVFAFDSLPASRFALVDEFRHSFSPSPKKSKFRIQNPEEKRKMTEQ